MRSLGWALSQYDWWPHKKRRSRPDTQRDDHVRTRRRQPSASQRERPQKEPTPWTPWSQTSSLWNYEKINFHCWAPRRWHFVWRPLQTHTWVHSASSTSTHLVVTCEIWALWTFVVLRMDYSMISGPQNRVKSIARLSQCPVLMIWGPCLSETRVWWPKEQDLMCFLKVKGLNGSGWTDSKPSSGAIFMVSVIAEGFSGVEFKCDSLWS